MKKLDLEDIETNFCVFSKTSSTAHRIRNSVLKRSKLLSGKIKITENGLANAATRHVGEVLKVVGPKFFRHMI